MLISNSRIELGRTLTVIAASPFCCGISQVTSIPSTFISSMRRCGEAGGAGHMTDSEGDMSLSQGQYTVPDW